MTESYHNFFLFSSWISIYSSRNKYICIYRHILGGGENNDGGMREGEEKRIRRKIYESIESCPFLLMFCLFESLCSSNFLTSQ